MFCTAAVVVEEALVGTGTLTVKGTFTCPPEFQGGKQRGGAVGSTMGFSYAAQAVEVSVDLDLGKVTVDKVWAAVDCGFAINPMSVEGQPSRRWLPTGLRSPNIRPCKLNRRWSATATPTNNR